MQGFVNSRRQAIIAIHVHGRSQSRLVQAVVDTGFNGHLSLPLKTIHELQLVATGARKGELADGTIAVLETFMASVTWEGQRRQITVAESESGCLLGMDLLKNSRLTIDVVDGGVVSVEPLTE